MSYQTGWRMLKIKNKLSNKSCQIMNRRWMLRRSFIRRNLGIIKLKLWCLKDITVFRKICWIKRRIMRDLSINCQSWRKLMKNCRLRHNYICRNWATWEHRKSKMDNYKILLTKETSSMMKMADLNLNIVN